MMPSLPVEKVGDIPDISIIIVSYNTKDMTQECLESLYTNTPGLNCQVIVIDNASGDGSVEMVQRDFPHAELIANDTNKGFAAANNQGFLIAKAPLVLLLNSDTLVLGSVIQNSVKYMLDHLDVGAFACRVLNSDRTTQKTCSQYPTFRNIFFMAIGLDRLYPSRIFGQYQYKGWDRNYERDVEVISGCYLLTRKEILQNLGGLDEDFFFFGEETEWCMRIRKSGWKLRFSPVGEIIHHGGGSAKKLKYKRDLMLTNALVRFHQKTGGQFAAIAMYCLLFFFNAIRALFWLPISIPFPKQREKAELFYNVCKNFKEAWPGRST